MATFKNLEELRSLVKTSSRVAVLGTGQTGLSLSIVLSQCGYRVVAIDEYKSDKSRLDVFSEHGVNVIEDCFGDEGTLGEVVADFFVASPGVAPDRPLVKHFINQGVPEVSELDLYFAFVGRPALAITGTNGKTTVASLSHEIFAKDGKASRLLGNAGRAVSTTLIRPLLCGLPAADNMDVVEVSSYQLEQSQFFTARCNIFLNFSPDHIERHGSIEEYFCSKAKLFRDRKGMEFSVLGQEGGELSSLSRELDNVYHFGCSSQELEGERGCFYCADSKKLTFQGLSSMSDGDSPFGSISFADSVLFGEHNYLNLAATSLGAALCGTPRETIEAAIGEFSPLPHRVELVAEVRGVRCYNDSKSTNPDSTISAIKAVSEQVEGETLLILGGKPKAGSMESLASEISKQISMVYLFGPYANDISERLLNHVPELSSLLKSFSSLEDLVKEVDFEALENGSVLFSPACASFDLYKNYEERGEHFKRVFSEASSA